MSEYKLGCNLPVAEWAELNRTAIFADPTLRSYVSPFLPETLMQNAGESHGPETSPQCAFSR